MNIALISPSRWAERAGGGASFLAEQGYLPDVLIRAGIRALNAQRVAEQLELQRHLGSAYYQSFVSEMDASPIAPLPAKANEQHYEIPADFYRYALGPHRKYSASYWEPGAYQLSDAERAALEQTCEHAQLRDGMSVLELGCGWGSLSLWLAGHYPNSNIVAVSNSHSQRAFIMAEADRRGLTNLAVRTCDMNDFATTERFDRVVSVEMFEHMRNYRLLLERVCSCLNPGGKLLLHIFNHKSFVYEFGSAGSSNWMGQYFFSGGIMPSQNIFEQFSAQVSVEQRWIWSGMHYEKTANAWLKNLDAHKAEVMPILRDTYGGDAAKWFQRWRIFFMACAELFGANQGRDWQVTHYLLRPA